MSSAPATLLVKLGGGLWSAGGSGAVGGVVAALASLARTRPVLIVPGGGPFADEVRRRDAAERLPATVAHREAIAAMDRYGDLLRSLLDTLPDPSGRGLRVLPCAWAADDPELPADWSVTSDSIAVRAAARLGLDRVTLIKPVAIRAPSVPASGAAVAAANLHHAAADDVGVDGWLATAVERYGVIVDLVDGRDPDRVADVVAGRAAGDLRITPT